MFVCAIATTFPTVIVSIANTMRTPLHSTCKFGNASMKILRNAAKPAAFGPAEINAAIVVGAPS